MQYSGPLLVVQDLVKSRQFYRQVLGLEVVHDYGANLVLAGGISLQSADSWLGFIGRPADALRFGGLDGELYFEEADFDGFLRKLQEYPGIEYVRPPLEHRWGQRAVRFFDPDHHIIEVGERLQAVCQRFWKQGLTLGEIALRMDIPVADVEGLLRT